MYPWYRDSVAAAAAAGLGGPVGVVGSGFCSTGPGQGATTIKTESGYSDCMLALDYVQSKVSEAFSSGRPDRRSIGGGTSMYRAFVEAFVERANASDRLPPWRATPREFGAPRKGEPFSSRGDVLSRLIRHNSAENPAKGGREGGGAGG